MTRNIRLFMMLIAALVLLLTACTKKQGIGPQANILRYPLVSSPTKIDPAMVQDGDTIDMLLQVFEGLVKWSVDNKPVPNLAESWEVLNGGTLYRFKIRQGVKFHNGDDLTAEDFVYSIDRACSKALGSETTQNYLYDIVGARERREGNATSVSGVRATGKYTLEIQIDQPKAYFLAKLTYPNSYVVSHRAIKAAGGGEMTKVEAVVGTGPFKLTTYNPDTKVILSAFEDYHGGKPKLQGIERPIVKDPQTRYDLYKQGRVDLIQMDKAEVKAAEQDPELKGQIRYFERPGIYYVAMNQGVVPQFQDKRVRQAFAMAIDKDAIIAAALEGKVKRADCIVPPGIPGYDPTLKGYEFKPDEAKRLLAAAGYPDGRGFPKLTLWFRESRPDILHVGEVVQEELKTNLGVIVELRPTEWGAYLNEYNNKALPFLHMRWMADYLDPQNFLSTLLATYGGENKFNYSSPKFDNLCRLGDAEQDPEKRLKYYQQAQRIAIADVPWIPIYFQRDAELIRPYVQGIQDCLLGHLPHVSTYIEGQ